MNEINWSEKAILKLLSVQFKEISKKPMIVSWIMQLIDSAYGKKEWLTKWTNDQFIKYSSDKKSKVYLLSQKFNNGIYADRVNKIEKYVTKLIYRKDKGEYWQTAEETLTLGVGDCEDQNNLIYILCRLVGVPNWLLYNAIGETGNGRHFYCLFYYAPRMELIPVDSTYYVETGSMADQKPFRISSLGYHAPEYIWNENHAFKWK